MGGVVVVVVRLELVTAFVAMTALFSPGDAFQGPSTCIRQTPLHLSIPWSSRRSAREGAVLVEWERVSEEEECMIRRYAEQQQYARQDHTTRQNQDQHIEDIDVVHQGVFCGYKVTKEDYIRLRSADPDEPPNEDYSI